MTVIEPASQARRAPAAARDELVLVTTAGVEHALPAERVLEVLPMVALTPVPTAPRWLAGVLDLRGTAVAVIDLRERLGLPAPEPGLDAQILVVEHAGARSGLLVDGVGGFVAAPGGVGLPEGPIAEVALVAGLARPEGRLVLVLDVGRLLEAP